MENNFPALALNDTSFEVDLIESVSSDEEAKPMGQLLLRVVHVSVPFSEILTRRGSKRSLVLDFYQFLFIVSCQTVLVPRTSCLFELLELSFDLVRQQLDVRSHEFLFDHVLLRELRHGGIFLLFRQVLTLFQFLVQFLDLSFLLFNFRLHICDLFI